MVNKCNDLIQVATQYTQRNTTSTRLPVPISCKCCMNSLHHQSISYLLLRNSFYICCIKKHLRYAQIVPSKKHKYFIENVLSKYII